MIEYSNEPIDSAQESDTIRAPSTRDVLMRGLFMVVIAIFFGFAEALLGLILLTQFVWLLAARKPNVLLTKFGKSLSLWFGQAARFQSCASEDKPFPWSAWPDADNPPSS